MKIRAILAAIMLMGSSLMAEEAQPQTILYFDSSRGDYIGLGKTKVLTNQEADFRVKSRCDSVEIMVRNKDEYWSLTFAAPDGSPLQPGIYNEAQRAGFRNEQPGLEVAGCHRGCNTIQGNFEILEISYRRDGQIEAFAANFTQICGQNFPPLRGAIRYNSSIPVEMQHRAHGSLFSLVTRDYSDTNQINLKVQVEDESSIKLIPLQSRKDGIGVIVDTGDDFWSFYFAAPGEFAAGHYQLTEEHAYFYPQPEIIVIEDEEIYVPAKGKFDVLEVERGEDGEILSLALDFVAENVNDEVLEGSIRYRSSVPVPQSPCQQ